MGSAVTVLEAVAVGISLVIFDYDFLFVGRALTFFAIGVPFDATPLTFSAPLTACLRHSCCGSTENRFETLGDVLGVTLDELWRAPLWRGKDVLPYIYGPFRNGVVVSVIRLQGEVFLMAFLVSPSISANIFGISDRYTEAIPGKVPWAQIWIADWCGNENWAPICIADWCGAK